MATRKKRIYKVLFHNEGRVYEIYAQNVSQGSLFGFVEIEGCWGARRRARPLEPLASPWRRGFQQPTGAGTSADPPRCNPRRPAGCPPAARRPGRPRTSPSQSPRQLAEPWMGRTVISTSVKAPIRAQPFRCRGVCQLLPRANSVRSVSSVSASPARLSSRIRKMRAKRSAMPHGYCELF